MATALNWPTIMPTSKPAGRRHAHTAAHQFLRASRSAAFFALLALPAPLFAQDPAEPPSGQPAANALPRPTGAISPDAIDLPYLRAVDEELVACGTRLSLSSWDDPNRGIGCARDRILARYQQIAKDSGGRLQVSVDKFEATSPRTSNQPAHLENIVAILPGSDPLLAKTVFLVSGHFDSRASDVMDPQVDAPGADDDASGVAVALAAARLLSRGTYRATLLFASVSGEEQSLLGGARLLAYLQEQGYQIGGFLNNDIVGADSAPGAPHRVRVFSGGGPEGIDSPSRELALAVEEIAGRDAVRLIFRLDRLGRGGDHIPFVQAGLPAVRFTEPLENYDHEHQTPRTENGREYGDFGKYLNFTFIRNVARDNAEVLRQLAVAPAPPAHVTLSGGVTPDAKLDFSAPEDPDRSGFEILWRETTDPRWSVYEFVATPGQTALSGVSTDNHFFAVRAVGKKARGLLPLPPLEAAPTP